MPRIQFGSQEKPPARGFFRGAFDAALQFYMMMFAVIGGGYVYNERVGDGQLPQFVQMDPANRAWANEIRQFKTRHLEGQPVSQAVGWEGLQPALKVLDKVAPEIASWVRDSYKNGRVAFDSQEELRMENAIAAYELYGSKLHVNNIFWGYNSGNQAAILAHEYRHFRQNVPKMMSVRLGQMMTGNITHYPCLVEDEAFQYQLEFYRAIGLNHEEIDFYLQQRQLNHRHDSLSSE